MIVTHKGAVEADLPVATLANSAPRYERPWVPTVPPKVILPEWVPAPNTHPRHAQDHDGQASTSRSRRWIWEQYDHMVMGDTVQRPGRRRRRRARARHQQGHRRHLRCHAALRARRSGDGHQAGRGRDLAQPDRRRRRSARHHRQHELRQPRAARGDGPVRRRRAGHEGSLRGAEVPGRVGQRLALQRDQRRRHPADAGHRRRRPRPRSSRTWPTSR